MTRIHMVLLLFAIGVTASCATPAAQISDDAVVEEPLVERVRSLSQEVDRFEGRPVLERDLDALSRMRGWLAMMAESPDEEAEIYEQAIRAQLEYLRTSELRYYAQEGESQ